MPSPIRKKLIHRLNTRMSDKLYLRPCDTGAVNDTLYVVRADTVNLFLYRVGDAFIAFDAGYRPSVIRAELDKLGIDPNTVTHVFLSHADIDHTQGLGVFKNAKIYLSHAEEPMITGVRNIRRAVRSPRIRRGYTLLREGDVVEVGDARIRAIETPGHTPGSMAYHVDEQHLFMGDTCKLSDGKVFVGRHYTMDYEQQKQSVRKVARLDNVRCVFTAHCGYTDDLDTAFADWR